MPPSRRDTLFILILSSAIRYGKIEKVSSIGEVPHDFRDGASDFKADGTV